MSATWFKKFEQCEAGALDELLNPVKVETTPMLVGNYIHSYFESKQAHDAFIKQHDADIKTRIGTLRAPFQQAETMIERMNNFDEFNFFYNNGDCEKEKIVTGDLYGVNWKGKIDSLNIKKGYFCDLKTTADIHRIFYNPDSHRYDRLWFDQYNYGLQMAAYKKLLQAKYHKPFEVYIFAVDKASEPGVEAIKVDMGRIEAGLQEIQTYQPELLKVLQGDQEPRRCGHCDYCRRTYQPFGFKTVDEVVAEKQAE